MYISILHKTIPDTRKNPKSDILWHKYKVILLPPPPTLSQLNEESFKGTETTKQVQPFRILLSNKSKKLRSLKINYIKIFLPKGNHRK